MVSITLYGGVDEIGGNKIIVESEEDHSLDVILPKKGVEYEF